MLRKLRMNMPVRNVARLIIPNGFFCAILAIKVGIAPVSGQLLCLYPKATGSALHANM